MFKIWERIEQIKRGRELAEMKQPEVSGGRRGSNVLTGSTLIGVIIIAIVLVVSFLLFMVYKKYQCLSWFRKKIKREEYKHSNAA